MKLGIIGTGGMARTHAESFSRIRGVKIVACCDIVEERLVGFADTWKIPNRYTDHRKMLSSEQLDAITNVTPDHMHAQVSIDALRRGIHVLCEKPMATTLAEAKRMLGEAKKADVINMVNYSKRNSSGLQQAAEFVKSGGIGRILHVEASYLQCWLSSPVAWGDWRDRPALTWRLSSRHGSLGCLGDLGCHIYDMATFLCGDIDTIYCTLATFPKKGVKGKRYGEYFLDANDSFVANVTFRDGALGTIHSSRWASGYVNRELVRIYGDEGAVEVDFQKSMDSYQYFSVKKDAWKTILCKKTPSNYERFIRSIRTGVRDPSDFANGLKIQAYLHYSSLSDREKKRMKVRI